MSQTLVYCSRTYLNHFSKSNSGMQPFLTINENVAEIRLSPTSIHPHVATIVEFRVVVHDVDHHIPLTWPFQTSRDKENEEFIRNSTLMPFIESSKILALLTFELYDQSAPEDVWYAVNLHLVHISSAPFDVSKTFAVEMVFDDQLLGVHRTPTYCHIIRKWFITVQKRWLSSRNIAESMSSSTEHSVISWGH